MLKAEIHSMMIYVTKESRWHQTRDKSTSGGDNILISGQLWDRVKQKRLELTRLGKMTLVMR